LAQRAISVPVGKKIEDIMARQITNTIENPVNDRISATSPHQQVTTVMTVTVSHLSIRGIGHENDDAFGAYHWHRLVGVRPARRPSGAPRQADAGGSIGIDLARLERAAGSISAWANWPVNDDVAAQARTNGAVVRAFAPKADRRSLFDRNRGTPHGAAPPTPPGIRVTYHGGSIGLNLGGDMESRKTEGVEVMVAQGLLDRRMS